MNFLTLGLYHLKHYHDLLSCYRGATYQITKGLSEGAEIPFDNPAELAGIGIAVGRDDFDKCTVSVQYTLTSEAVTCNNWKYCGDESYAVDCYVQLLTNNATTTNNTIEITGSGAPPKKRW